MTGKQLTDRRQSTQEQIAYYRLQARLARQGLTDRSEAFFLRQILFLQTEGAR
jgi:hypothetical protein